MNEQLAVRGHSRVRGFTATRDGSWLLAAEGSTLTFFDLTGPDPQANLEEVDGQKRVPAGRKGILANRTMLDPDAAAVPTLTYPGGNEDLLYVAAGRDGLWVMEAYVDPNDTGNLAWRVDDSGNLNAATQNSRRWCSDVAVMTVAGKRYLLALFARKSQSRLRVYELDDVRGLAQRDASGLRVYEETDDDLTTIRQVMLGDNPNEPSNPPNLPPNVAGGPYGRSVALAMTVDVVDDTAGAEASDVYVAMAHHGVVRVRFSADPDTTAPAVEWGPLFGTGTPHAVGTASSNFTPSLYRHAVYWEVRDYATSERGSRFEAPVFADVAVYDGPHGHFLYVACDHLFWLQFDLSAGFGPTMNVDHHPGYQVATRVSTTALIEEAVSFAPDTGDPMDNKSSSARALEVVSGPNGKDYLVVTTGPFTFLKDYSIQTTEGYSYDHEFFWGGGSGQIPSDGAAVYVYEITATAPHHQEWTFFDGGGSRLFAPAVQATANVLEVFHNTHGPEAADKLGFCRSRIDLNDPIPEPEYVTRAETDTLGRLSFQVAVAENNPNLLLPCGNDGSVPIDGFVVSDYDAGAGEWRMKNQSTLTDPRGDDSGPNGLLIDPESQWIDPVSGKLMVFCGGTDPVDHEGSGGVFEEKGNGRGQLVEIDVPADVWSTSPSRSRNAFFVPGLDEFGALGRMTYRSGFGTSQFDHLVFVNRIRSVFGLTAFERQDAVDQLVAPDPQDPDADNQSYLVNALGGALKELVTHPEFNWLPTGLESDPLWKGGGDPIGQTSNHYSWTPRYVPVQSPGGSTLDQWVLAVPCGTVRADPSWKIFDEHPEWLPQAALWNDSFSHGLVQFFPMEIDATGDYWPTTMAKEQRGDGVSPLSALIGPEANGMIWKVLPLTLPTGPAGELEVFLFSVDFSGHLYVHAVHDILTRTDPDASIDDLLVASWDPPEGTFDELPNSVWDIAIDYPDIGVESLPGASKKANIYVSVRRVGIVVLEFDPLHAIQEDRLQKIDLIQTAEYAMGLAIREIGSPIERQLVVSDHAAGIRIFGAQ